MKNAMLQPWDSQMMEKRFFIITRTPTKSGRKSIDKGTVGYVEKETEDEFIGTLINYSAKQGCSLKKDNLQLISRHEAQLLIFTDNLAKRLELLQNRKLFSAISALQENDLVVVRHNNVETPGVVKRLLEKGKKGSNGLDVLKSMTFEVELLQEAEHRYSQSRGLAYPVFNAGEILQVSSVDRPKPAFKADEHKGAQKQRDLGRQNSDSNAVPQRRQAPERPCPPAALSPTAAVENGRLKRVVSGGSLGSALQTAPLELGSLTELQASNGATVHGVVRWIGVPEGKSENWAGVELDYELKDCLDGQLGGQRYFNCDRNKGMFVKLRDLRPDSRFLPAPSYKEPPCYPEPQAAERRFEADSRNEDAPPISESSALQLLEGRMKGIQGHYNSCYLDSALFSLFSFSPALDSVLHCPVVSEELIQSVLRRDIVNRLRRQGFVPAENVMKLRQLLGCDSFTFEEKDPEEFLSVLLHQVLSVDPLLKIRSNEKTQDCYSYQIILEREEAVSVPSVQLLLERSFLSCDLKFEEIPSCLIIQMPRFGKKFKMFPKIIPSTELDITDLLYNTPRECFLCGAVAELECYQCLRDPRLTPGMIKQFCRPCDKQVHSHRQRQDHQPREISLPRDFPASIPVPRQKMELFAVLCIETSHYVSFVKYGQGRNSWLFFDSMADRSGDENIPEIKACPQVGEFLSQSEEGPVQVELECTDVFVKRLLCDSYMFMYQCPALCLYR
ncbi:ubiquitin carboxyl-terminal hydrolase CYLD-like isoform X2 [Acipenser ruthenus]|uniref:ubiquitin carboxyl-terminal hydrolase CYLD-like isoform X2 n=1 Tax=Acipenser ruthenus TaxID=7906 RepID=UPI0027424A91|nr:ubiquitin carboxyl-terminal hydrolase CYLD-like isoform X2 [Acipenser ruthenus]